MDVNASDFTNQPAITSNTTTTNNNASTNNTNNNSNNVNNTNNTNSTNSNLNNQQLEKIAFTDAEELKLEAIKLKSDASDAFTFVENKKFEASQKNKEALTAIENANTEQNNTKKEELQTKANELKEEAKKLEVTTENVDTKNESKSSLQKIGLMISFGLSLAFSLGLSLFLFKFLPLWITDYLSNNFPVLNQNYLYYNMVDGVLKTTFFVVYIALLGLMPSLHRVFQYHGAEHKSIYTYEKGLPLNIENAKKMTRFHPRCGTSFILVVFLISIFIYTFVPRQPDFWMNFGLRVAFLPLVAGVAYEVLKWSAKYAENPLVRIITLPGLLFQRITTQEPSEDQLEVALTALRKALELEENELATIPALDVH
jgi:uncharacterized protein YqhQ